jgi:hypothetical protein
VCRLQSGTADSLAWFPQVKCLRGCAFPDWLPQLQFAVASVNHLLTSGAHFVPVDTPIQHDLESYCCHRPARSGSCSAGSQDPPRRPHLPADSRLQELHQAQRAHSRTSPLRRPVPCQFNADFRLQKEEHSGTPP